MLSSKNLLAVYVNLEKPALLIIANKIVLFLDVATKETVFPIFELNKEMRLHVAETVQAAAAFEVDTNTAVRLGQSHIVFDTKAIGLLIRYCMQIDCIKLLFSDDLRNYTAEGDEPVETTFQALIEQRSSTEQ